MSALTDFTAPYKNLSFSGRMMFYSTVSNEILADEENLQPFLIETRMPDRRVCICCDSGHAVKNGTRKDSRQGYLCRDCGRSFIPGSRSAERSLALSGNLLIKSAMMERQKLIRSFSMYLIKEITKKVQVSLCRGLHINVGTMSI